MKVRELIEELQKIDNKELDVVVPSVFNDGYTTDIEVDGSALVYYGKAEEIGWVACYRDCVAIE